MLKFKVSKEDHGKLDDAVKALYTEKDGAYVLGIEGVVSDEEVNGLKAKVDELLSEKKAASQKAKEAEEAARKAADDAARKNGDVQALEESWKKKFSDREAELTGQIDKLSGNISSMLVDSKAGDLANELALPGSAKALLPHIKARLAVEERDGQPTTVVRDASGKASASSLDDLKKEFAADPAFAPLIAASKATGGGASGGGSGGGAAKTVNRSGFEQMSAEERMEFSKAGGSVTD